MWRLERGNGKPGAEQGFFLLEELKVSTQPFSSVFLKPPHHTGLSQPPSLRVVPHPFPQPGLIPGTPLCSSPSLRSSGATRSESQSAEPSGPSSDATESWSQEGLGPHSRTQPFSPVFGGGRNPDSLVSPEASSLFGALPSKCFWREDIPLTLPSSFHSASSPLRLLISPTALRLSTWGSTSQAHGPPLISQERETTTERHSPNCCWAKVSTPWSFVDEEGEGSSR